MITFFDLISKPTPSKTASDPTPVMVLLFDTDIFKPAITIFVSCLGLLGLAANAAERRKKELGVRKVLGATVEDLVVLLSKDFVKLVLISILLASPVAWYFMNQWLDNFPYRITISWWMFAVAGVLAVVLALLTVSFQAVKAALSNPVKNLRTE